MDQESENMIRLAIEENCKNKTVIVISHRLSFIEKMDRIFVVNDKQITEVPKYSISKQIQEVYR